MANRKIDGVIPSNQVCVKCGDNKTCDEFYKKVYKGKTHLNKICKKCVCNRVKKYKEHNIDKVRESKRQYWNENRDRLLERNNSKSTEYRKNNPEKKKASAREWARRNRSKIKNYRNNRYKNDPAFNIQIKIRRRIYMAIFRKRGIKENKTIELLGCTAAFFKDYIEGLFIDGMDWSMVLNSEIHLDHKIPCSKFNLLDPVEQAKCFHYTNIQPLWAKDNLLKHDKIE